MKTVRIRIAVAVDPSGHWSASGWLMRDGNVAGREAMEIAVDGVDENEARYWLEAEVPIPEPSIIHGTVTDA